MTSKNEREVPRQNQQIPQGYPPSGYPPPDFYAQHGTPPAYSYPAPAGITTFQSSPNSHPAKPTDMQNIRHSNKGILGIRTTIKEELWLLLFHQAITTNNNNRNSKQVDGFKDAWRHCVVVA
ncbi:uncharacterized protein [Physcomitrium patens]|uniref:uncharacterized protein isoform X2 n=1 Tax=Physcomitrium patens TaxID=3218 RepID=UPI003CCCBBB9